MWPISVFLVAANDITTLTCRKVLNGKRDIKIIGETNNTDEATEIVKRLKPRILLLDITLNQCNHTEFVQRVYYHSPHTCIVLLTHKTTPDSKIIDLLINGALGYIESSLLPTSLPKAIRHINSGEDWISRKFVNVILEYLFESTYHDQKKHIH